MIIIFLIILVIYFGTHVLTRRDLLAAVVSVVMVEILYISLIIYNLNASKDYDYAAFFILFAGSVWIMLCGIFVYAIRIIIKCLMNYMIHKIQR